MSGVSTELDFSSTEYLNYSDHLKYTDASCCQNGDFVQKGYIDIEFSPISIAKGPYK